MVVIRHEPFAATWLQREVRSPRVRLRANTRYWDGDRGPHLEEVIFRNDLTYDEALERVCMSEGEVDIVTMVPVTEAARIEESEHAKLVAADAVYSVAGIFDRNTEDLPLGDARARQALNLAIGRDRLVEEGTLGYASPLAALTPDSALPDENPLSPYPHDVERARELWSAACREAGVEVDRPLRVATFSENERIARSVAEDIESALGMEVEVIVYRDDAELRVRRRLAEKKLPHEWDVLIFGHGAQSADGVALEVHRAFVGESGELRAGPVLPEFESLYGNLVDKTDPEEQVEATGKIDRYVYDESLALFLVSPKSLYAVNRHVDFIPYTVTFELAQTTVDDEHWSRTN